MGVQMTSFALKNEVIGAVCSSLAYRPPVVNLQRVANTALHADVLVSSAN
jgi:hypothetical protein